MLAAVAAFAALVYGPTLGLSFIGDDYVFLDETRAARFADLWSFHNTRFGWYRPWSREVHFWALQHLAGLNEVAFRVAGLAIWVAGLAVFFAFVRRLAGGRVAAIATLGVTSLALWGTPILWLSGSQDLWMILLAMATVLAFARGVWPAAAFAYALALLSKETAGVLPLVLVAYVMIVERGTWVAALRRTAWAWAMTLAWVFAHPVLVSRLLHPEPHALELEHRPALAIIVVRSVLATVNLDLVPLPVELTPAEWARIAASALALLVGLALALRLAPIREPDGRGPTRARLASFGVVWAVAGWVPLVMPSVGWHAYYGCLGAMGAWLAIAIALERRPAAAVALVAALALLRGAHAATPSWDWGNEWYQRRAGNILVSLRRGLLRLHPTLPPRSRLYFGHVPNNIGLIAGDSPAVRVWYRDPTIEAGFYSDYRPRRAAGPGGSDYFFRVDTLVGLVEVETAPEAAARAFEAGPAWERDHENLAMLFLRAGDPRGAASQFELLAALPSRADALLMAAVCRRVAGESARADSLQALAVRRSGQPAAHIAELAARLRATVPAPPAAR